ncbi:unnamed protein product [Phaeothamnion confervicola]
MEEHDEELAAPLLSKQSLGNGRRRWRPLAALLTLTAFAPRTASHDDDDDEGNKADPLYQPEFKASYGDLLELVRPDWPLMLCAFAALMVAALGQVFITHFTGQMVDSVVERGPRSAQHFRAACLKLVYASAVAATFTGLRGSVFTVIGARCNKRIRVRLFGSLLRQQEIGFFDTTKTGDLTSRLSADTAKIGDQVTLNVNIFLRNFVQAVGTMLFMSWLSWRLSLVTFVSIPIIVFVSRAYGHYVQPLAKKTQDKLAEASTVAEETFSSMSTVRSFHAENAELEGYNSNLVRCIGLTRGNGFAYVSLNLKSGVAYGFYAAVATLLPQLVTALVLWFGGRLVLQGALSGGGLVSFMLYMVTLSDAFYGMGDIYSSLTQAIGAADKVFCLMQRQPKIRKPATYAAVDESCEGLVELRDVSFEYPARPGRLVLDRISFKVRPGQVVALVGPSGGGKSSCVALIQNFYHCLSGTVTLDGRPVEQYAPEWFHRHVSIVGQEPTLYARSIRRNIIYGLEGTPHEPTDADIERAARLARAHDFIVALPDKYETDVGDRGVQISGGQKQRIAIARALVRRPRVLLLDEATASLDSESEHQVQEAIDGMMRERGMTLLVIAHRLSTVRNADRIVCIEKGRVVESGTHDELCRKAGIYAKLVARQLGGGGGGGGVIDGASAANGTGATVKEDATEDGTPPAPP